VLTVEALRSGYGRTPVLFDVSLAVDACEVLALLGRNGMGKTTTIAAMTGMLPVWGGKIVFRGQSLDGRPSHRIGRLGIGLVPEGRQVFPTLSVEENLVATSRPGVWTVARIWDLFPRLLERRRHLGSQLSGGEQQMLAIGRALMTNPMLLVLDEATEGLAPVIRAEIWAVLARLKADGLAILVVDKNLGPILDLADRVVVLEKGRSVWTGVSAAVDASVKGRYLGV
jgi:branched-chain amino acid transport system ATP-binding protein